MTTANPFLRTAPMEGYRPTDEARLAAESPDPSRRGAAIATERNRLREVVVALEQENHALRALVEGACEMQDEWVDNLRGPDWMAWRADAERVLAAGGEDESE